MKNIKIKSITLTNFKGARSRHVEFSDGVTKIAGRNGSGKTTIFDAFTWVLFGKDSKDRKAFSLKTLAIDGKPIPRLPHEVTCVLDVDGEKITLTRRLTEKWVKHKGDTEAQFGGHNEERLYNDVPCSVKEWGEKISSICPENVFRMITSPSWFVSQDVTTQRTMLMQMAGGVSDTELAAGNKDFEELLNTLTGKTFDEYCRELAAKKRRVKQELDGIPERIDERERSQPEAEDWAALEAVLKTKQEQADDIHTRLENKAALERANADKAVEHERKIGEVRVKIERRQREVVSQAMAAADEHKSKVSALTRQVEDKQREHDNLERSIADDENYLDGLNKSRANLIEMWQAENAKTLTFDDDAFVCPTCKRPLEIEDIEAKQAAMLATFNKRKADNLAEINYKGHDTKQRITDTEAKIEAAKERQGELGKALDGLKQQLRELDGVEVAEPDIDKALAQDAELKRLNIELRTLSISKRMNTEGDAASDDKAQLRERLLSLNGDIDDIKSKLRKRDVIEQNNARIAELKKQLQALNVELAGCEREEHVAADWRKAKITAVESRINGMFGIVNFKMFKPLINGGEVETCEAMVNGVPYSDLNSAMKLNAGLDIINTICGSCGTAAPVVIDNSEGVLDILPTQSQQIRLYVANTDFQVMS